MNELTITMSNVVHRMIVTFASGLFFIIQNLIADIDDSDFFNSLDLTYLGMQKVADALSEGDTTRAKAELLEYFRFRTSVHYFELPSGGDISQADENIDNYFTIIGIKLYAGENDGTINWSTSYPGDSEWHWQFHRMDWLVNLARVYGRTYDEKYAEAWVAQIVDWATDNPAGYPRSLDTGNRLKNWIESYHYIIYEYGSPSISAEDHFIILKKLMSQIRYLKDNWRSHSNWGASETRGMTEAVVTFPEFNFYPDNTHNDWIDLIQFRLTYHLEQNFLSDGVQYETSPMYHYLTYRNLLISYELMVLNNVPVPEAMRALFIRPAEVLMHVTRPDGFIPQLADSDKTDRHLYYLQRAATAFNREDFRYVATRGQSGSKPDETFAVFPDGGLIAIRTGWNFDNTDKYLLLHFGSNLPWHAHYDILNVEIFANGRPIVVDPGRYTYSDDGGWRDYFKNSTAHNIVVIDGKNQDQNAKGKALWTSTPGYMYIDAWHNAYQLLNNTLQHKRKILFVKPYYWIISDLITGTGSHSYVLYYHMDALYRRHHTFNRESGVFSTPDYAIVPADSNYESSMDFAWLSYEYGEKTEAPVVAYRQNGPLPATFESLVVPLNRGETIPQVRQLSCYDGMNSTVGNDIAFGLEIVFAYATDIVSFNHEQEGLMSVGTVEYKGDATWIRQNPDNTVDNYILENGSDLAVQGTMLISIPDGQANIAMTDTSVFLDGEYFNEFTVWNPYNDNVYINGEKISVSRSGEYLSGMKPTSILTENQKEYSSRVFQNYPNPFNATTLITYQIKERSHVTLQVYDILGRHITTLTDRVQEPGEYSELFNAKGLSSGIYFYKITADEFSVIYKIVLVQ